MDAYFSTSDLIPSIHTTEEAFYFFFIFFFTHNTQIIAFWLPRIGCTFINIRQHSDIFTLNINLSIAGSDWKTVWFIYTFIQRMEMLKITAWENPITQETSACCTNTQYHHLLGINLSLHYSSTALWYFPLQNTIASGLSNMSMYSWLHVAL